MLKKQQLQRFLEKATGHRDDLKYRLTLGGTSYFLCAGEEARAPSYRWLKIGIDESTRELAVSSGVSHFPSAQEVALAPAFSRWKRVDLGPLPARSKQTLRKSLKQALTDFQPLLQGGYALLQKQAEDPAAERALSFFYTHRQQLQAADSEATENLKRLTTSSQFQELCRLAALGEVERDEEELEGLLEALAGEGTFTGSSAFSLNQEKALAKLSNFQLGERYLFPLFLASGLYLRGAKEIQIDIDSDEIWVKYQGCEVDAKLLQRLPTVLLSQTPRLEDSGLQKLAQALLQSAGRKPTALEWRSKSRVVDLRAFPELELDVGLDVPPTTEGEFYSKLPFSLDVVKRFVGSLGGEQEEERALRRDLTYLPIPWRLNGEEHRLILPISEQSLVVECSSPTNSAGLGETNAFYRHNLCCDFPAYLIVILNPDPGPSLTVMVDGLKAQCPYEWPESPVQCFLWLSNMATDLSGRKLVKTRALEELLEATRRIKAQVREELSQWFSARSSGSDQNWTTLLLHLAAWDAEWETALRPLPFLPIVAEKARKSLPEMASQDPVYYSTQSFSHPLRSGFPAVDLAARQIAPFTKLFPQARDATSILSSNQTFYEKYQEWLKLPQQEVVLSTSERSLSGKIPGFEGVIGFTSEPTPRVVLLNQNRPLPLDRSYWAPEYVEVVINCDELEMNDQWKEVYLASHEIELRLLNGVEKALRSLLSTLAAGDFDVELNRLRMEAGLAFLKRRGYSLKPWSKARFIREVRTEMDTTGPIPLPHRVEEFFSLEERPDYLDSKNKAYG